MSKHTLSRRTLLRGALQGTAVSLSLPILECMLGSTGEALATGERLPGIFGIWYCGNGVTPECFVPPTTGTDWRLHTTEELRAAMQAVEPAGEWAAAEASYLFPAEEHPLYRLSQPGLRDMYSLVTGCAQTGWAQHWSGQTSVLSGGGFHRHVLWNWNNPSADQVMADHFGGQSLVMMVNRGSAPSYLTGFDTETVSARWASGGGTYQVDPYVSAQTAFRDLFGSSLPQTSAAVMSPSVLDYVRPQLTALSARVSATDRARLDQHFTALREVESALAAERAASCTPTAPHDLIDPQANHDAFVQVLTLALACGLRRSFSLAAQPTRSQQVLPGGLTGQHSLQHRGFLGDGLRTAEDRRIAIENQSTGGRTSRLAMIPSNRNTVRWELGLFADLLESLAATSHGAGSLLDASGILGTFELWDGNSHGYLEHPVFVAGGAHGRLVRGQHIRTTPDRLPQDVVLSIMRAAADRPDEIVRFGDTAHLGFPEVEA